MSLAFPGWLMGRPWPCVNPARCSRWLFRWLFLGLGWAPHTQVLSSSLLNTHGGLSTDLGVLSVQLTLLCIMFCSEPLAAVVPLHSQLQVSSGFPSVPDSACSWETLKAASWALRKGPALMAFLSLGAFIAFLPFIAWCPVF